MNSALRILLRSSRNMFNTQQTSIVALIQKLHRNQWRRRFDGQSGSLLFPCFPLLIPKGRWEKTCIAPSWVTWQDLRNSVLKMVIGDLSVYTGSRPIKSWFPLYLRLTHLALSSSIREPELRKSRPLQHATRVCDVPPDGWKTAWKLMACFRRLDKLIIVSSHGLWKMASIGA